jgi:hypothetical protein
MKVHTCEQGSPEWLRLRLGIPTASEFERIVTPTGKLSAQARPYAFRLVTERVLQRTTDSLDHLQWVERGKELEPQAVRMYEFRQEVKTRAVGFCTTDDGRLGASPDRLLVGEPGGLEIKCPAPHTHIGYMLDGFGAAYLPQVMGQMLVCELEWVDRFSFHPEMPPVLIRTHRDEAFIARLAAALDEFCDMADAMEAEVRASGHFAERAAPIVSPVDAEYAHMQEAAHG